MKNLKDIITPTMVADKYLGRPNRQGAYLSPFRREKTASFKIKGNIFHDFGDGNSYDIYSFIQKYFNCNFKVATKILANDFNILLDNNLNRKQLKIIKKQQEQKKKLEDAINNWYEDMYDRLTNIYKEWVDIKYLGYPANSFVYTKIALYEQLTEDFLYGDKVLLYNNKEVYEQYV